MGNGTHGDHPGRPLHLATRKYVEGFLSTLASSPGIAAWQVEQATDALTILLGSVFGQEWALNPLETEKNLK